MTERFYAPTLRDRQTLELTGPEAHHLMHVLRLQVGGRISLFDGEGTEATAKIVSLSRNAVELHILETRQSADGTKACLILGTAVPKGERFRWLVEKATELGVDRLVPLATARSVVRPANGKLAKMRQTVVAACKQSGRGRLMTIDPVTTWDEFLARDFPGRSIFVAHPEAEPIQNIYAKSLGHQQGPPNAARASDASDAETVLAIGPEGGFTDREIELAVAAGARLVSLGSQTLRIETAAITMAAFFRLLKQTDTKGNGPRGLRPR